MSWHLLLLAASVVAKETWHLVDVPQVVCPKPTNLQPGAPALAEYNVGIEYTSDMRLDRPYIVSFMRTSKQAMSITFKIEDADSMTVVPTTTVNLQALTSTVPAACTCTSPTLPAQVATTYGANYGTSCSAWDEPNCGLLWGNTTVGPWCCRSWCYASKECPDSYRSQAIPGQYFSYAACNSMTTPAPADCQWTQVAQANDPCLCRNVGDLFSAAMKAKFPLNYGAACNTWDYATCDTNYAPDQVDTWCCASWCYVDKACPSAKDSLNDGMQGILYWSDLQCEDDIKLMLQCPFQPDPVSVTAESNCTCLTDEMPESVLNFTGLGLNATTYNGYGTFCAPHDYQDCQVLYPGADMGMWCCMSWCYVPESCATGRGSTIWPGRYWSMDHCQMDTEVVSSCAYDSSCQCRGQLPSGTFTGTGFNDNYGSSCQPWDSITCKATWQGQANSTWNSSGDNAWCCDSWCYVNGTCPIAKLSWFLPDYYWSYTTCDDPGWTYTASTDTCVGDHRRRYQLRRLSGRRRSSSNFWTTSAPSTSGRRRASSGSSSLHRRRTSSPRRRAAGATTTADPGRRRAPVAAGRRRTPYTPSPRRRSPSLPDSPARRRAYTAPSAPTARRRSVPRRRAATTTASTPRRRVAATTTAASTPRRRAATTTAAPSGRRRSPTPPSASDFARRRAPSPPPPATTSSRRRTTGINGQTYTTTRRRAVSSGGVTDTTRRRRTTAYGYDDRPTVANNHGGTMPSNTNYGYSSSDSSSAGTNTNVATYAAAGAGAAAVAGAGAYFAYNNMYNSDVAHRRRRASQTDYKETDWCVVTASGERNGAFMECAKCYDFFGYNFCPSASGCNTPAGCSYTTPVSFSRDDLAATGFIPNSFKPPLRVTFSSITSSDINTDPVSGICPPQTAAQADLVEQFQKTMSFKPDLFLVLTKQAILRTANSTCDPDTTVTCTSSCFVNFSTCQSGFCTCQSGYCWNGERCAGVGIGAAAPFALFSWPLLVMLFLRALRWPF